MDLTAIGTVILAAFAVIGATGAGVAWFYRRGQSEQKLVSSVDRNTEATEKLADQVGGLRDTLQDHAVRLADHDARLRAGGL